MAAPKPKFHLALLVLAGIGMGALAGMSQLLIIPAYFGMGALGAWRRGWRGGGWSGLWYAWTVSFGFVITASATEIAKIKPGYDGPPAAFIVGEAYEMAFILLFPFFLLLTILGTLSIKSLPTREKKLAPVDVRRFPDPTSAENTFGKAPKGWPKP